MKSQLLGGLIAGVMMIGGAPAAFAQASSTNVVDCNTAWCVFAEPPTNPTECWGVSVPKETVNTDSSGRIKAVRRGEILLFVTYRPGSSNPSISFTGGYPFAQDTPVTITIGDDKFEMFTDGEWAWPLSTEDDAKILAAMKRGADALLTGRSTRGTITKDTFSLFGFTAVADSAQKYCAGS